MSCKLKSIVMFFCVISDLLIVRSFVRIYIYIYLLVVPSEEDMNSLCNSVKSLACRQPKLKNSF